MLTLVAEWFPIINQVQDFYLRPGTMGYWP